MGRRLLFGSKSALARLGIVDGREIFPILGAEDDDPADSGNGDDSGDDDASDNDSDDDDDSDDDSKPAAKQRRNRTRTNEFNRLKRERNALLKEKAERDKATRDAELKNKSEAERAVAERDDAMKELTDLRTRHEDAVIELEIVRKSKKYSWNDIEDVLNDRAVRKAIEIGEDGEITGVEDALKDLAKRKPHFLAEKSTDDKGKGNGQQQNGNGQQQQPQVKTGGQPNTGNNGDRAADRQRLNTIYPALQRLQ